MKCPRCGKDMEEGFVNAPGFGIVWGNRPLSNLFKGEVIIGNSGLLLTNYHGFRCKDCGFILVQYTPTPKTLPTVWTDFPLGQ